MDDARHETRPRDPRVQAALDEYFSRVDRGELIDRNEFLGQHPDVADALRSFLATDEQLQQMADLEGAAPPAEGGPEMTTRSVAEQGQETVPPQRQPQTDESDVASSLPAQFGRYRVIKPLGRGAMGTVFLAEDTQLQRQVALKTPSFDDEGGELLERFYREARAAATLRHNNICPVFDVGEIDGRHYISMAYIEGRPLAAYVRPDKPPPERQALLVVRKLALALEQAHAQGVIHRDLKPSNIMVDARGEPVVMDFGLARSQQGEEAARLTQSGVIIGSPAYMSPEQVEGDPERITPATDQYSLGVILYELLTGRLPFRGPVTAVIGQILTKEPPPVEKLRPELDPRIAVFCRRLMAKRSVDRFPSMQAAADELTALLKDDLPTSAAQADPAREEKSRRRSTGKTGASASHAPQAGLLTASGVSGLLEVARKCMAKHDYEQVIQMLQPIPDRDRTDAVYVLLHRAQELTDEVNYLLVELDEALRMSDTNTALAKADEVLKLKPEHRRARDVKAELTARRPFAWLLGRGRPLGGTGRYEKPWGLFSGRLLLTLVLVAASALGLTWAAITYFLDAESSHTETAGTTEDSEGAAVEWVPLFDGVSLDGWVGDREVWKVEGGAIVGVWNRPGRQGTYLFTQQQYESFVLKAKFKLDYGNTGIMFRCLPRNEYQLTGYQADMAYDDFEWPGVLYGQGLDGVIARPTAAQTEQLKQSLRQDGWNDYEITADGNHIVLKINGITTVDTIDDARSSGVIGLQLWHGNTRALFKDVLIRELPASETQWTKLFNSRNLDGWTIVGDKTGWSVAEPETENARIVYDAGTRVSWLSTNREFADFELQFEYKLPQQTQGNSGVFLRADRQGNPNGAGKLEVQILDDDAAPHAGFLPNQLNGALWNLAPVKTRRETPAGKWHRMEIRAAGPRIRVAVDGTEVLNVSLGSYQHLLGQVPGLNRKSGYVGLQRHKSHVEFRNVRIRELGSTSDANARQSAALSNGPPGEIKRFPGRADKAFGLHFSPDDKTFHLATHNHGATKRSTAFLWDVQAGQPLKQLGDEDHGKSDHAIFSPNGRSLFIFKYPSVRQWDVGSGRELTSFKGGGVFDLSNDGRLLLNGDGWNPVQLWDLDRNQLLHALPESDKPICFGFSASGDRAIACCSDRPGIHEVIVFSTRGPYHEISRDRIPVEEYNRSPLISPDGTIMAVCRNSHIMLWGVLERREIGRLRNAGNVIEKVAFSGDGKYLLSGAHNKQLKFWDVEKRAELFSEDVDCVPTTLALSSDGKYGLVADGGYWAHWKDSDYTTQDDKDIRLYRFSINE